MKTLPLKAALCLLLYTPDVQALSTGGYTFAPVCNPSITVMSLSSTIDCFSLTSSVLHPGAPDSYYSWSFGDGTPTETGRTLNHCYASETVPGNTLRTVTLNYFNPTLNCSGSATATLNVSVISASPCPNVPPPFTLAARTVTVWAGSLIPEIITSFDFGDGTPSSTNAVHTYTACGNYIVTVSQWDMNMPNRVCMEYVAINISCSVPTDIAELTAAPSISLFPNPTSDVLYVKSKELIKTITITDALGKHVLVEALANPETAMIQTSHLPAGTYFMSIVLESGARGNLLFMKH